MAEVYSLAIPGAPPRKNERHRPGGGRWMVNSDKYNVFCARVRILWAQNRYPKIERGGWQIYVENYWPRLRHLDVKLPFGDVDASMSWIMDSLQAGGCMDDDVRFLTSHSDNFYDKENPRVEIELSRHPLEATNGK